MHRRDRRRLLRPVRDGPARAAAAPAATPSPGRPRQPSARLRRLSTPTATSRVRASVGDQPHPIAGHASVPGSSRSPGSRARSRRRRDGRPDRAREPALLRDLRRAGRSRPRRHAWAHGRASAASAARRSRSSPSWRPATSSPASTRSSAASPTAGSAGSTSPATATCPTGGSCSRALLNSGRRGRDGGRAGRAAVPRRGRAPEHRQDLQLRRARRRRLHRHGVRRRHEPASQILERAARRRTVATPTRSRPTRRSPTCSRSSRRSATCTTSGCCSATSSPTTSSRPTASLKLIDLGGVYRMDDAGRARSTAPRATRRRRSPTPGRSVASDLFTVGAHARGAVHSTSAATRARTGSRCPPATTCRCYARTTRSTGSSSTGNRAASRRSLPDRRGDGRPAVRRPARGRRRPQRASGRPAPSTLFTGDRCAAGLERPDWRVLPASAVVARRSRPPGTWPTLDARPSRTADRTAASRRRSAPSRSSCGSPRR